MAKEPSQAKELVATLNREERDVLIALVSGSSNKQIADGLRMSLPLVEHHRAKLISKIGAKATADAVRIGIYARADGNGELPTSGDEH